MHTALSILAVMQLLLVCMWLWLMARYFRTANDLVELRARIHTMPTHEDLSELSIELARVKANTETTLNLVTTIHNAMMGRKS
jgi:hypothetical protein